MGPNLVLSYAACGTCRKALAWFRAHGIPFTLRPIVESPPTLGELESWIPRSEKPLRKWLNTSGQSYRALGKARVDAMSDLELMSALVADGKLVKRPVIVTSGVVLIGFDEDRYASTFINS